MTIASYRATQADIVLGPTDAVAFTEAAEHYRVLVDELQSNILTLRREVERLSSFEQLAHHDELTGLCNRRQFTQRLAQEWSRARRYGAALSLVVIDLDDFKLINDTAGHPVGDEALQFVGRMLGQNCREYDVPCRLGGDEFAYILPETDGCGAETMMARLDHMMLTAPDRPIIPAGLSVKMSYGIAEATEASSPDELFALADEVMYMHKRVGKQNRRSAAAA